MANSDISKKIQSLLNDDVSPVARQQIIDEARQDLVLKLEEYRKLYDLLPAHRYENDTAALESAFTRYQTHLTEFQANLDTEGTSEAKIQELLVNLEYLKGVQFDFKEIIWCSAGPSTHPGLNELLVLLEQQETNATLGHIEREWERIEMQEKLFSRIPLSLRTIMQDLLSELRVLLQATATHVKAETGWKELASLKQELLLWGKQYSHYDMGGLHLKYSGDPTEFPDVNFALNSRRLYLENFVSREVTEFAFRRAQRSLDKVARAVRSERSFRSEHKNSYHRHHASVEALLDRAQATTSLRELRKLGTACVPVVAELNHYQKRFTS